ncbi:Transposable element Tc1 transposase [Portunus trituberculatus]|uniref:Transposable element Tc1 transposase n=1 Tax=Portunus trituberculatus TaxID=210409 RepID=A0A5B7F2H0_PORTR|nr:Transposable element Tc1 transposase [Portunus trituberculatus]
MNTSPEVECACHSHPYGKETDNVAVRTVSDTLHLRLKHKKVTACRKPALNEQQKKAQKAFVSKYLKWPLEKLHSVLWTDESLFVVCGMKGDRVWAMKGIHMNDPKYCALMVKHPASIMVWADFGYGDKGPLLVLPQNLMVNQQVYLNILDEHLGECFANSGAEHNGAPAHRANSVKNLLKINENEYISD